VVQPNPELLPHPCGLRRAAHCLQGGLLVTLHNHKPVQQVAGGHPLGHMDTDTCVEAFISKWVARFGLPPIVTLDKGSQFTSNI
jgi:hypothetical protein